LKKIQERITTEIPGAVHVVYISLNSNQTKKDKKEKKWKIKKK